MPLLDILEYSDDQPRDDHGRFSANPTVNGWIKSVKSTEKFRGKKAAIETGQRILGSAALGRPFGETAEKFQSQPHIAEFSKWLKDYSK